MLNSLFPHISVSKRTDRRTYIAYIRSLRTGLPNIYIYIYSNLLVFKVDLRLSQVACRGSRRRPEDAAVGSLLFGRSLGAVSRLFFG